MRLLMDQAVNDLCFSVPFCKCGRKKSAHDGSIAREDTSSDQWTPERCTRELPTDAYGEIDFLGLGRQTKRVPVSL